MTNSQAVIRHHTRQASDSVFRRLVRLLRDSRSGQMRFEIVCDVTSSPLFVSYRFSASLGIRTNVQGNSKISPAKRAKLDETDL
jgi:hypothetical protein